MSRRLLLFSHEATLSGAPMQLLHFARWLHRTDWDVTVAAPVAGPITELLARDGVAVHIEPDCLAGVDYEPLRKLCAPFDVVVVNTITPWQVVRAAHVEEVPVIWYLHETDVALSLMEQIPELRPTLPLADLVVTPTRHGAALYEPLTRAPVEVIPYGIPDLGLVPRDDEPAVRLLALGSVEKRKGQDVLLAAIRLIDSEILAHTRFKIVGRPLDKALAEELNRAAAELATVEVHGGVSHEESAQLLRQCDVFICASRDETMPVSIIEALSCAKTVVSTAVGGIPEWLFDGSNALLFRPDDPEALAQNLTRCIGDPALRHQLAQTARRTFERHFTIERFGAQFLRAFDRVQARQLHSSSTYQTWVANYDTVSLSDRIRIQRELRTLRRHPLISIIVPVYNPQLETLRAAIDSVRTQLYDRWELCLADDASTDPQVVPFLRQIAAEDSRIKFVAREVNGHIAACSNSALGLATGEWCGLLDQDDALAEHALASVVSEIDAHPEAALIYSDEDKIDEQGRRSSPFFKTDWNPELFLGQNYINHLGVYRADVLKEIGGFREGYEGSQDYDLVLRFIERSQPQQIRHIPRVLYHWRTVSGSLAALPDAKPYARDAARRALNDHLERRAISGTVTACPENEESHRVIFELGEWRPLVSIVILTRDRAELLQQCIESVERKTDYDRSEIVIVDNRSREAKTLKLLGRLRRRPDTRVITDDGEFNFSRLNNLAAKETRGELLLFLNNDIVAENAGWLSEMVSHFTRPSVGIVGARLWYPDDTLQHGGVILGLGGAAGHAFTRHPRGHPGYFNRAWLQGNYSAVTGACLLIRRSVFEQTGGFNERELAINFNDVDLCLRARSLGCEIVWTPYANLTHHESASRGHHRTPAEQEQFRREVAHFQKTWGETLLRDPYYNPNLSLHLPGFELAFPPRYQSWLERTGGG